MLASGKLKGITVEISSDVSKMNSSLSGADSKAQELGKSLRAVESVLRFSPDSVEMLAQKEKYATQQAHALEEKLEALKAALNSTQKGTDAYDELERQLVSTASKIDRLNAKAKDASDTSERIKNGWSSAAAGLSEATSAASSLGDALKQVASGAAMSVGSDLASAVSSLATAAVETAVAWDSADATVAAATGSAAGYAEQMSSTLRELYADGWGDSIEGLTETAVKAREVLGELNEQDLSGVITSVETMESVFGSDVTESLRGVNVLMEKFGLSATEACDLMMSGMQRGLDYTDELGDNLSEYAGRWAETGMSATEYFSLLQAGVDAGAYSLDKVGDYLNEFLTSLSLAGIAVLQ